MKNTETISTEIRVASSLLGKFVGKREAGNGSALKNVAPCGAASRKTKNENARALTL
jgi:hypothetical protein